MEKTTLALVPNFNRRLYSTMPINVTESTMQFALHPYWVTGFADGESCFYVKISKKSKGYSTGVQVMITFSISQHVRDELLLIKFIEYLGCGNIEKVSTRPPLFRGVVLPWRVGPSGVNFVVYKFSDIFENFFISSFMYPGIHETR